MAANDFIYSGILRFYIILTNKREIVEDEAQHSGGQRNLVCCSPWNCKESESDRT